MPSRKKLDVALRREALTLIDTGLTSTEVGQKLRVKKMTVCGWMAARTKGQYDDEGVARSSRVQFPQHDLAN